MAEEKKTTRLIELEPRLVLLFLAIGGPFLLAGCLLILGWLRAELNQTLGEDMLGGAAADAARYLDTYLLNNLANVSLIASIPTLRAAANASNRRYVVDGERIRDQLLEIDGEWVRGRGAVPIALDIVGNDTSKFLREIATFNPSYQEILLTDRQGALAAATNITTDYYQADEPWWQQAFGDGEQGTSYSSGVIFDTSAGGHELEMAVPVLDNLGGVYSLLGDLDKAETTHSRAIEILERLQSPLSDDVATALVPVGHERSLVTPVMVEADHDPERPGVHELT